MGVVDTFGLSMLTCTYRFHHISHLCFLLSIWKWRCRFLDWSLFYTYQTLNHQYQRLDSWKKIITFELFNTWFHEFPIPTNKQIRISLMPKTSMSWKSIWILKSQIDFWNLKIQFKSDLFLFSMKIYFKNLFYPLDRRNTKYK